MLGFGCSRLGLRVRLWAVQAVLSERITTAHTYVRMHPDLAAAISGMLLRTPPAERHCHK